MDCEKKKRFENGQSGTSILVISRFLMSSSCPLGPSGKVVNPPEENNFQQISAEFSVGSDTSQFPTETLAKTNSPQ